MTWSTVQEIHLLERKRAGWEEVAENLNKIQQVYFKVDKRAVRDRYNLLSKELRNKLKIEEKGS